jgi:hypothetical protein
MRGCGCGTLCIGVFLIFLLLKLAGIGDVAQWSWWSVIVPLWIWLAVSFLAALADEN